MTNLLTDPWLPVTVPGVDLGPVTLPGLFAQLMSRSEISLPRLRPHQAPALHAFLVQLAYMALEDSEGEPPVDEAGWRAALRGLTSAWPVDEPWTLAVKDLGAPAFLQSPSPAGTEKQFNKIVETPDALDLLVTSRNHDVKQQRMHGYAGPSDWVLSLISLQTQDGFLGAGNYGIVRMNGGFSSRPQFRLAVERGMGAEFRRDLTRLREAPDELWEPANAAGVGTTQQPVKLVWLEAWDGTSQLSLERLHPLAIESCRRVRMEVVNGRLQARRATSKVARVRGEESHGVVGDPWIPLDVTTEPKALTAQVDSLSFRQLSAVLFDSARYRLPMLALPGRGERAQSATLVAQVLVRGQGRTEILQRREVPVPPRALGRWATRDAALATRAKRFVTMAGTMHGKVLRTALVQFVDGTADPAWTNPQYPPLVAPWVKQAEELADREFFARLFESIDADLSDEDAEREWANRLQDNARQVFALATAALPTNAAHRVLASARARSFFEHALRRHLPALRVTTSEGA